MAPAPLVFAALLLLSAGLLVGRSREPAPVLERVVLVVLAVAMAGVGLLFGWAGLTAGLE